VADRKIAPTALSGVNDSGPGLVKTRACSELALTGATGFIGATLASHLTAAGWHVRALYRPLKGRVLPNLPGVQWFPGTLEDEKALNILVNGTHAVIHCAGAVRGTGRTDFDRVNEDGAMRVALATASQTQVPRFLLISSLAAREPNLSFYSGSKWRGECAVKTISENLRWTVMRPSAVFGPGDRELLPLFRCIAKGFAPLPAGANGRFSLIYVDDLATAVMRWLAVDACDGQTFELHDGQTGGYDWDKVLAIGGRVLCPGRYVHRVPIPVSLLALAASVNFASARLLGYAPMLTPGKIRELTHPDWVCDNFRFSRLTGWQPTVGLAQGLACIFGKKPAE